ncbi:MAG: hypothetical protein PHH54_04585 [Candidatus Nanoarchaeia archaeon]|nr:hypothetical protein [Candidatus Nanoarchaeia archaeon]MDD5741233.1 hypothetical protein [Candidatus Nanoarchaeia archaeon]
MIREDTLEEKSTETPTKKDEEHWKHFKNLKWGGDIDWVDYSLEVPNKSKGITYRDLP